MKLYLWRSVLTDYTDGIALAIADSRDAAIEQIMSTPIEEGAHEISTDDDYDYRLVKFPDEIPDTFVGPLRDELNEMEPEVYEFDQPFALWRVGGA